MKWDEYMAWKEKQRQATVFEYGEDFKMEEKPKKKKYEKTTLEDFEPYVPEPLPTLEPKIKFALQLLGWKEYWNDMDKAERTIEKAKANILLKKIGYEGHWLVGCGIYFCALCDKDGEKHKLQKVNYLGNICKECAIKYQKQIQEMFKFAIATLK